MISKSTLCGSVGECLHFRTLVRFFRIMPNKPELLVTTIFIDGEENALYLCRDGEAGYYARLGEQRIFPDTPIITSGYRWYQSLLEQHTIAPLRK